MQEKTKEPEIRFAGFTGAWEQRKLSDLCSMHARIGWQNLRTSEFLDQGQYLLITGTDFDNGSIRFNSCHFVKKERYDQDKNIQVKNGSILITKDGTLGKVAYVENLNKPATLNAGVFNVKTKGNDVDNKYLFQYLKAPFLMKYVDEKSTGGTIKHLNQSILVNFPVVLPGVEEQRKIGEFLSHIDSILTLHQRKYEKLLNIKKSMLEKMFPKEGEVVPEIRFKGFTGAWEQRKLGAIVQITMGQSPDGSTYSDTPADYILVQGNADLKNGWVCPRVWTTQKTKFATAGDLIMSVRAPAGSVGKTAYDVVLGRGVASLKGNEFIYQSLVKMDFDGYWKAESTGSTFESLSSDSISTAELYCPSEDEQHKIGIFLSRLDSLLTLHQRKLEMLKNVKQAFLEKMFV